MILCYEHYGKELTPHEENSIRMSWQYLPKPYGRVYVSPDGKRGRLFRPV